MKLYFQNSHGERRLIGRPETTKESWEFIKKFCADREFEIPYVQTWITPEGEKYYDVSSHTEFFIEIKDDNES